MISNETEHLKCNIESNLRHMLLVHYGETRKEIRTINTSTQNTYDHALDAELLLIAYVVPSTPAIF